MSLRNNPEITPSELTRIQNATKTVLEHRLAQNQAAIAPYDVRHPLDEPASPQPATEALPPSSTHSWIRTIFIPSPR